MPPATVKAPTGARRAIAAAGETAVAGAPAYMWRDGCGPTSVGMIVGYYDGHGFPDLVAGDASSQSANPAVSQTHRLTRKRSNRRHYEDYSLPKETYSSILADKSAAPAGDEHGDDSVADFMHTSRSAEGLAYGWSYTNMAGPAFVDYVQSRLTGVTASYHNLYFGSSLTFATLQREIDAGRPLVLSVDSSGDGVTDHAIVGIGYRETNGYPEYACWDTWYATVRWQQFRGQSRQLRLGSLRRDVPVAHGERQSVAEPVAARPSPSPSPSVSPSPDPGDLTAPMTTVHGSDSAWHRSAVTLTFSADDAGGSGVGSTQAEVDWAGWAPLSGAPAVLRVAGQGVHTVRYRSMDLAGNLEEARACTVKIDAGRPTTSARAALVRRGARVTLRYRVADLTPRANVRLVVKTTAGAPRKTLRPGWRGTNALRSASWRCMLARGTYRFFVYATRPGGQPPEGRGLRTPRRPLKAADRPPARQR